VPKAPQAADPGAPKAPATGSPEAPKASDQT
jgi:hypothetical protein